MEKQKEMLLDAPTAALTAAPHYVTEQATGKRLRTIVADDSSTFIEIVCALLEWDGKVDVVARVRDGVDALEAVAKLRPDLVLMDIDMPSLDGLNAAMIIASRLPSTRIVLMSAEESPALRADAQACGAESFIYKPRFREEFQKALGLR